MSFRFTALRLNIEEDLLPLSAVLHQRGLVHRIFEESGQQVLKVDRQEQVQEVVTLYAAWRSGEVRIDRVEPADDSPSAPHTRHMPTAILLSPITVVLIALSVLGFLLYYLRAPAEWLSLLTFTPLVAGGDQTQFNGFSGQYWRLLTPAFLHFGWLHIAFNSLWLWELGSKIEKTLGAVNMLLMFCTIALISNTAQFAFAGSSSFGGMSGVVYGLLGFSWAGAKIQPLWGFAPPRSIMIMMVGWLLFCMAGVVEVLGFGAIANAAHLGGLVSGALLGAVFGYMSRFSHDKT